MARQMKIEQTEKTTLLQGEVHKLLDTMSDEEAKLLAALRDPVKGPKLRAIMRAASVSKYRPV